MADTVTALVPAWHFTGDIRYAESAAQRLRAWFLDPATRMNPNMRFGQKHRGHDYNHGTWYKYQLVLFSLYGGNPDLARTHLEQMPALIFGQVFMDGRQPQELIRTRSLSYSIYNARALVGVARLGRHLDFDLFAFRSTEGRSIRLGIDYVTPLILGEKEWPGMQIRPVGTESAAQMYWAAAIGFEDREYAEILRGLPESPLPSPIVQLLDPLPIFDDEVTIAVGGDWDDLWGDDGATQQSLVIGAAHDIILMAGDLSYDGIDDDVEYNIQNARDWSAKVNAIVGKTPVLFVAGDHDSRVQDGDIMTYANALVLPDGTNGITPPTGKRAGLGYEGKYPYLWFNDIIDGDVKVRVVGTSSAFQESPYEPVSMQKYLVDTYAAGSENYKWIEAVYADAKDKGYWILHLNHLPWIDMGKNQSFSDSLDLIDLASTYGVNILATGSSHNFWRTKPLKIDADRCPTIALTSEAQGEEERNKWMADNRARFDAA
jgi:hypothetical protein